MEFIPTGKGRGVSVGVGVLVVVGVIVGVLVTEGVLGAVLVGVKVGVAVLVGVLVGVLVAVGEEQISRYTSKPRSVPACPNDDLPVSILDNDRYVSELFDPKYGIIQLPS